MLRLNRRAIRLPGLFVVAFLLMTTSGCDEILPGGENVVVTHQQEMRFSVTQEQLLAGEPVSAQATLDVSPTLNNVGFARNEIVLAEVTGAELRLSLVDMRDVITSASVNVALGGGDVQVATASTTGAGRSTAMQTNNQNITVMVRGGTPQVQLGLIPVDDPPDRTFDFRVVLNVRLTLEGI